MDMQFLGKGFMLFTFSIPNNFSRSQKQLTEELLDAVKKTTINGIASKEGKMTAVSHGPFSHTYNSENEIFEAIEEPIVKVIQSEPTPFKLTIVKNDKT